MKTSRTLKHLATIVALTWQTTLIAQTSRIQVDATQSLGAVSPFLTGACIEDVNHEVYGGIYSQMIFGESFQEPPPLKAETGQWSVRDQSLQVEAGESARLGTLNILLWGNAGVELRFNEKTDENAGLFVQSEAPLNGAKNGYEVSLSPARQLLRVGRCGSRFELIKEMPCEVPVGKWVSLEVRRQPRSLEVLVDGKPLLKLDKGVPSGGTVGLSAQRGTAAFRNFWVNPAQRQKTTLEMDLTALSGMWRAVRQGSAAGRFTFAEPFTGTQSQQMSFDSGAGEWGIENQGLNRSGMNFVADKPYEGYVCARADKPTTLYVALENTDGTQSYAETALQISGTQWQRLPFTLTPRADDKAGRFALKLKQPGSVSLGHAFLQPGEWGRFKGLPVRRDVAEALIQQGVTFLRYGGCMANAPEYKWKKMIGPRDERPPYKGWWYPHSSNGWGIIDFMDFCEAAGFEYIPDFNINETPQDMADFLEYAKGSADTEWGRHRVADGHPKPYQLRSIQLGNEERVNEEYAGKFEALASAIWAKDPGLILVVGDFAYQQRIVDPFNFAGAAGKITSLTAQQRILKCAKAHNAEVWFDVHVGTHSPVKFNASLEGLFSFADALGTIAEGAKHKVVIFEFNANNHDQARALANAQAIHTVERNGRIPVALSANCLQVDGQNDNDWDQGLLFLNGSQVWLQPPGYITQMLSNNYLPHLLKCAAPAPLDVNAKQSADGKTMTVQVLNTSNVAVEASISLKGFALGKAAAKVTELAGPLNKVNTAEQPMAIAPKESEWAHGCGAGNGVSAARSFAPNSYTVVRFE